MNADDDADEAPVQWARGHLDGPAEAELLRARPWSVTWLLRTPRRTAFLKVTGPASHYEAALMHRLSSLRAGPQQASFVPDVLASDPDQGWLLMANAGPTLFARTARRTGQGELSWDDVRWDPQAWQALLTRFAQLQRAAAAISGELISAGVPDERPHQLAGRLTELLRDSPNLASLTGAERDAAAGLATSWSAELATLAATAIPASVQHGDLHDNNVSLAADGLPRYFDFGDASIAHPFTTMLVPLRIAASRGASGPDLAGLRVAYLSAFVDVAPLPDLEQALDAALRLALLHRATSWDRALTAAPPGHQWGEPVAQTLRELLSVQRRPDRAMDRRQQ